MLGKLGADAFGVQLRDSLEESNVNTAAVQVVPGSSGVALITTDARGENAITVVAGANAQLSPADLDANIDIIRGAGILLTQLEIPFETVEHLAEIAAREGIPLMLDPAPARSLPRSLLECVDWLTPNETETAIPDGASSGRTLRRIRRINRRFRKLAAGPWKPQRHFEIGTPRVLCRARGWDTSTRACAFGNRRRYDRSWRCLQRSFCGRADERTTASRGRVLGFCRGCDFRYPARRTNIHAHRTRSRLLPSGDSRP